MDTHYTPVGKKIKKTVSSVHFLRQYTQTGVFAAISMTEGSKLITSMLHRAQIECQVSTYNGPDHRPLYHGKQTTEVYDPMFHPADVTGLTSPGLAAPLYCARP